MDGFIERVSWEDVGNYLNDIVNKIDKSKFLGVYGVPRGGLVMAAWLSHKLYLPLLSAPSPNCIIIDDICDSGETLLHYVKHSSSANDNPNYFITTMYYRENQLGIKPDLWYAKKEDKWIVFPWEE